MEMVFKSNKGLWSYKQHQDEAFQIDKYTNSIKFRQLEFQGTRNPTLRWPNVAKTYKDRKSCS